MSKISDDLFWSFPKILLKITSRKFLTTFFQSFLPISTSSLSFPSEHLSGCPHYPGCRSSLFTHLPLLFTHLPVHFSENSLVGCPRLDARGRRTPRTPLSNYDTIWSLYL